jgi:ubiquinone/menaquinone biosynthesis C-methylase UbiE
MRHPNGATNPWLSIPAADYERHMQSPRVLQQQFLSEVFREILGRRRPSSIAVLGCTTGNGFEHVDPLVTVEVVGIDINPEYLAILRNRFGDKIPGLRLLNSDIAACDLSPGSMDIVHCALIFEYVDPRVVLPKTVPWLGKGGVMSVVIQLPSAGHDKVTETEFKASLSRLDPIMRLIDPAEFVRLAAGSGLAVIESSLRTLSTGKCFYVAEFARAGEEGA